MKNKKLFKYAFGLNEYEFVDFPCKFSNIKIARLVYGNLMGCSWCFPHGWETSNSRISKNRRSWKYYRKRQWKEKKQHQN
jgi:hypothetical protein